MRKLVIGLAAVLGTLLVSEVAKADGCRRVQQVVVQEYAVVPVQAVQVQKVQQVQAVYAQPVIVQRQVVRARSFGGYGYSAGAGFRQNAIGGGGGLGTIINRQNILAGVGAAAGAAVFPGAAPLGAAAGAILGNIVGGGQ